MKSRNEQEECKKRFRSGRSAVPGQSCLAHHANKLGIKPAIYTLDFDCELGRKMFRLDLDELHNQLQFAHRPLLITDCKQTPDHVKNDMLTSYTGSQVGHKNDH